MPGLSRLGLGLAGGCAVPAIGSLCLMGLLGASAGMATFGAVSQILPQPGGYMLASGVHLREGAPGFPNFALPCGPEPGALAVDPSACTGHPEPFPADYQGFSTGQCTWYVATRRRVEWRTAQGLLGGNGGQWLQLAEQAGYAVGAAPQLGAIAVYGDGGPGHVAFVIGVDARGDYTVAEANWIFAGPVPPYVDVRGVTAGGTGSSFERLLGFVYGPNQSGAG